MYLVKITVKKVAAQAARGKNEFGLMIAPNANQIIPIER